MKRDGGGGKRNIEAPPNVHRYFFPRENVSYFGKTVFCDKHMLFLSISSLVSLPPIPFFLCKYCIKLGIGGRRRHGDN